VSHLIELPLCTSVKFPQAQASPSSQLFRAKREPSTLRLAIARGTSQKTTISSTSSKCKTMPSGSRKYSANLFACHSA